MLAQVDKLDKPRAVKISSRSLKHSATGLSAETHLCFSPDSRRLAVVSQKGVMILNLATTKSAWATAEGEVVSSIAWLDRDHIGYVAYSKGRKNGKASVRRTFWRQSVHATPDKRQRIYESGNINRLPSFLLENDGWPQEYWSTKGTFVVFGGGEGDGKPLLLDVRNGSVRPIGKADSSFTVASWRPDQGSFVWFAYSREKEAYEMFLLDIRTSKTVDLTGKFDKTFRAGFRDLLGVVWTPDGRHLVIGTLGSGGYLVEPVAWRVRPIGMVLSKCDEGPARDIRCQAARGLLLAELKDNNECVVDYTGRILTTLGRGGLSGWTLFPDGKTAVKVELGNRVVVRSLNLQ